LARDLERRGLEWWPAPPKRSWYVQEMRTALDHPLVALEMEEVVENGRATGVRAFSPFLDADLVDFLLRTPPELLSHQGRSKGLVRDSLTRRFPDLGFERQRKVSATSYARSIMSHQTAGAWRRYGGVPALAELGVIDERRFAAEVVDRPDKTHLDHFRIWDALNLEAWLRPRA
jgi:asparagine synthase (glutamine-hydrolysing)